MPPEAAPLGSPADPGAADAGHASGAFGRWVTADRGALAVFLERPGAAGSRRQIFRLREGEAAFLCRDDQLEFLLSVTPEDRGASLIEIDAETFLSCLDAGDEAAIGQAEAWIQRVARAFAAPAETAATAVLAPGVHALAPGASARAEASVAWIEVSEGGLVPDLGPDLPVSAGEPALPFAAASAGTVRAGTDGARIDLRSAAGLSADGALARAFRSYQLRIAHVLRLALRAEAKRESVAIGAKAERDGSLMAGVLAPLAARSGAPPSPAGADPLVQAFCLAAHAARAALPENIGERMAATAPLALHERVSALAAIARVWTRPVRLRPGWWRSGGQVLLAFRRQDGAPVALRPLGGWRQGFVALGPDGSRRPCEGCEAADFDTAYVIQRSLPDRPMDGRSLLAFALPLTRSALWPILLVAVAGGIVGMVTPIATQILLGTVIPNASRTELLQLVLGLVGLGLGGVAFELVRGLILLRLVGMLTADLEGAVWGRLLRLPATFFRTFSSGDLALRAGAIDGMRDIVSGLIVNTVFSLLVAGASVVLLVYYDWRLALVAVGLMALQLAAVVLVNFRLMRLKREALAIEGRLHALSVQLISAVAKIKVAGGETRAFARWADLFIRRRAIDLGQQRLSAGLSAFQESFRMIAMAIVLFVVATYVHGIGVAHFVAFNAAYGQFIAAMLVIVGAMPAALSLFPLIERAAPVLAAVPEDRHARAEPGRLRGDVELNEVTFRYEGEGPPILDRVSLHARPGEFIAVVGPSGAGKSTLVRLLLGFETPSSGTVFYDRHDLADVDVRAVRRQIGVVLQNGHASSGSILENIIGSAQLSEADAWEAARRAGLAEDIEAMPMRMQTFVGENGSLLSGGQRQRLLIARALSRRPRILILDEATSALDNRSQQIVTERLDVLEATRIVIAHRLSTIARADRIYVISAGRIVEQGTFTELMEAGGLFVDLVRRQMA